MVPYQALVIREMRHALIRVRPLGSLGVLGSWTWFSWDLLP